MSKYVDKVEAYKHKVLDAELEKLETDYKEAEEFYRDTGHDRYFNKMQKCEKEIEEIKDYLHKDEVVVKDITTDEYKEYLKMKQDLKVIKNKLFYLVADLGLPATADLVSMRDILMDYD